MNIEIKIPYAHSRLEQPLVEYSVNTPGQETIHGSAPMTIRQDSSSSSHHHMIDSGSYVSSEPAYTVEVSPSINRSTVRKETRRYVTTTPAETVTRRYVTHQPTETVTRRHYVTSQPAETMTRRYVTTSPAETVTRRYVTTGTAPVDSVTRRSWVTTSQPNETTVISGANINVTSPVATEQPINQYTKTTTTTVTTRDVDSSETSSLHGAASSPPTSGTIITPQQTTVNRQSSRVEVDENRFQVTLDVSQYKPEDIEVKVDGNKLVVRAESKAPGSGGAGYTEKEFFRQYTLPEDVDGAQVRCYFAEDGTLTLEAPRVPRQGGTPSVGFNEQPRFTQSQPPPLQQGSYTFHTGGTTTTTGGGLGGQSIPIHMRVGTPHQAAGGKTVPIVEEVYSNYGSDMESNRSFRK